MALATVQANSLKIADIAEITEGISYVEFTSVIDERSYARSADIYCTLVIQGVLNMDSTKKILGDESKKMLEWSLVASNSADCYKAVEVSYTHNDVTTKYKFSHAFPVSYKDVCSSDLWGPGEEIHSGSKTEKRQAGRHCCRIM